MILYRKNITFSWQKQRFYTIKAMFLKEKKNIVVFCVPSFLMIKDSRSISKASENDSSHHPFYLLSALLHLCIPHSFTLESTTIRSKQNKREPLCTLFWRCEETLFLHYYIIVLSNTFLWINF